MVYYESFVRVTVIIRAENYLEMRKRTITRPREYLYGTYEESITPLPSLREFSTVKIQENFVRSSSCSSRQLIDNVCKGNNQTNLEPRMFIERNVCTGSVC